MFGRELNEPPPYFDAKFYQRVTTPSVWKTQKHRHMYCIKQW